MARPLALFLSCCLVAAMAIGHQTASAQQPDLRQPFPALGLLQLRDDEEQFLVLLNHERTVLGLAPLTRFFDLEDDAQTHTAEMVEEGDIYHTEDLSAVTTGWEALGENVGYGPTVAKLHTAFMNSPHHRDNVVGRYDRVGIAAQRNDADVIFVTFIFMRTNADSVPHPDDYELAISLVGALWRGVR